MFDFSVLTQNSFPHRFHSLKERLSSLNTLESLLVENQQLFVEALKKDFNKPEIETLITEVYPLLLEIQQTKKKLKSWMKRKKVATPISLLGTRSFIEPQPKGCSLIISPWNYPVQLALGPMIPALAAGNTICLKPSEITVHTADLLKDLIEKYFSPTLVQVCLGGVPETEKLLALPFNHIFFTGSTAVGKKVMEAASKNLSTVTLELGGKSPTLVDPEMDLTYVARKISWGKFLNAGQTCVAPDYVFVPKGKLQAFKEALKTEIMSRYESQPQDLASIVSAKHFDRLKGLLNGQNTESLLPSAGPQNYFPPTLAFPQKEASSLMNEEIFGPILPILEYENLEEALSYINSKDKPLALYLFSKNKKWIETVLSQTTSGGVCINDQIIHLANHHLPFGGVGPSGQGAYHGYAGFCEFTHFRSVMKQSTWNRGLELFYPPYTERKLSLIKALIRFKI